MMCTYLHRDGHVIHEHVCITLTKTLSQTYDRVVLHCAIVVVVVVVVVVAVYLYFKSVWKVLCGSADPDSVTTVSVFCSVLFCSIQFNSVQFSSVQFCPIPIKCNYISVEF